MIFLYSIISGILYRLGGIGKPFNTKYRDFGVPVIAFLAMLNITKGFSWVLVISIILLGFSLTTYWKCISRWIGESNENVYWYNWFFTGLGYGLAFLPLCYIGISMGSIIGRAICLGIFTMLWSELISNVDLEEWGRGFLIIITVLFLRRIF